MRAGIGPVKAVTILCTKGSPRTRGSGRSDLIEEAVDRGALEDCARPLDEGIRLAGLLPVEPIPVLAVDPADRGAILGRILGAAHQALGDESPGPPHLPDPFLGVPLELLLLAAPDAERHEIDDHALSLPTLRCRPRSGRSDRVETDL